MGKHSRKKHRRKKYSTRKKYLKLRGMKGKKLRGGINTPDSSFGDISDIPHDSQNTTINSNDWSVNQPEIEDFGIEGIEAIPHAEDDPFLLDDNDLDLDLNDTTLDNTTQEDISFGGKRKKKKRSMKRK
jgi:hypothetical protein